MSPVDLHVRIGRAFSFSPLHGQKHECSIVQVDEILTGPFGRIHAMMPSANGW
jgi:hypothetical protein